MYPATARESVPAYSVSYDGTVSSDARGELRLVVPPDSPCTEVLLEFDPKLIWVSGADRVPGAAVFKLKQDAPAHSLTFGAVNDSALTATISVFFRDAAPVVLATQDCVVQFKKSPGLPEPFDTIAKTTDWIHRRLNIATYLIFGGALLLGTFWLYVKFQGMEQPQREVLLTRMHLAPGRYAGDWKEEFLIGPDGSWLNSADWNLPAQQWRVRHSPAAASTSARGMALINTAAWGMPQPDLFHDQQLYDYGIQIRCNLKVPNFACSWVLRAQGGGTRGYVFNVRRFNNGIRVEGQVKWRFSSAPLIPVHGLDIIEKDCCHPGDYLILEMQASNYNFQITSFTLSNDNDYKGRDFIGLPIVSPANRFQSSASSSYHSLQLVLRKSYAKRVQFGVSVVYSHAMDDSSDFFDTAGEFALPQNSSQRSERGPAAFDLRLRSTGFLMWDLPSIPAGATSFTRMLSRRLFSNWHSSGIFVAQSGHPYTINTSIDVNGDGNATDRLNCTSCLNFNPSGDRAQQVVTSNPANLLAPLGLDGAVGRNTFTGDRLYSLDLALIKSVHLHGEHKLLNLRFEMFNVLNHADLGLPVRILESPGFGRSISMVNKPRTLQVACKLVF